MAQRSLQDNLAANGGNRITYFAQTDARNKRVPFGIKREDRSRHTYVIGKTGMGKSTLLENMAIQDIQNGEGLTFIDPHGSTAEKLLEYIPADRVKDVLYFAPFDLQYPISFNILENVDADKRHFVISGLMSTFEKIWVDAWSARMAYILQNTLAALLEFPGATLLGVNRMYIDKDFRKRVVANITDPSVKSFWEDEYTKFTDRYTQEATPAIQNKIGQFASNALVRNIIGQPTSAFNVREMMDNKKIFIINLSKGRVGENNANLLGSMLITKIYLAAMSRADAAPQELQKLPDSYLYVDEFQNFANKSFADILSEARKYKLALTIAHQYIEQMEEEVRAAVFGNVGTMITFRVGSYDAAILEKEFAPAFTATDIVNLDSRQIYLKLMIDGVSSQPFSATTLPPIEPPRENHRDMAIAYSRRSFAQPRSEVESWIRDWVSASYADPNDRGEPKESHDRRSSDRRAPREGRSDERPRRERPERSAEDLRATLATLSTQTQAKEPPAKPPVQAAVIERKETIRVAERTREEKVAVAPVREPSTNDLKSVLEKLRQRSASASPERNAPLAVAAPKENRGPLSAHRDQKAGHNRHEKNPQQHRHERNPKEMDRAKPSAAHTQNAPPTSNHLDELRSQLAKLSGPKSTSAKPEQKSPTQQPQAAAPQPERSQTHVATHPREKPAQEKRVAAASQTHQERRQEPREAPRTERPDDSRAANHNPHLDSPEPPSPNREIPEDVLRKLLYVDRNNP
jgi:hypothetical protein